MTEDGAAILLADDDRNYCAALGGALRRRGFAVYVAHSLAEAQAEARAWNPKYAVVDLRLGADNGLALVQHLTEHRQEIKVVVLTGYGSIATAVDAVKKGAVQYLTKPVSVGELIAAFSGQLELTAGDGEKAPSLDDVEWEHLQRVLRECDGNVSEAARRLSMHRRTLQRKLARNR